MKIKISNITTMLDPKQQRNAAVRQDLRAEMRPPEGCGKFYAQNNGEHKKQRCQIGKRNLCRSGDSWMTASAVSGNKTAKILNIHCQTCWNDSVPVEKTCFCFDRSLETLESFHSRVVSAFWKYHLIFALLCRGNPPIVCPTSCVVKRTSAFCRLIMKEVWLSAEFALFIAQRVWICSRYCRCVCAQRLPSSLTRA